jgi:cellulose synthase/poly-beta-1,6-N-acetylglucosamine synthase-like glycosyltransferase
MTLVAPSKIVPIELSEPLMELRPAPFTAATYAIFVWRGTPLGHRQFLSSELPLTPGQLAIFAAQAVATAVEDRLFAGSFYSVPSTLERSLKTPDEMLSGLLSLSRPLDLLTQEVCSDPNPDPTISVAICTRERPRELARCIDSVLACSDRPSEIIVIDNAPITHATAELASRFPQIRYVKESRRGLSAARNSAMAAATGEIVAFADDDVVVAPTWIKSLKRSFRDPMVMVVTGLVLPAELETRAQVLFENLQYLNKGYRRRYFDSGFFSSTKSEGVPVWSIGAGANMAVRKEAFSRGYLFDSRLGPGVFGGCGEDSAYWYNLLADGWACLYDPSVVVYHYHRRDLISVRRQVRQYMQGHVAALLLQFFLHNHRGNLKRLFLVLPRWYATIFQRLVLTGFPPDDRILFSGLLGYLAGFRFAFVGRQAVRQP